MRYQERIYIQNENSAVRNKDILNVNMSSDICVFESPLFNLSGGTKINCTGFTSASSYVVTATTIPFNFVFTANTNTFTANSATFKYEVYKYNSASSAFTQPAVYSSIPIQYSAISGTSSVIQNLPVSGLSLDGEYIIKGYYDFPVCTDFLNRLGKTINTRTYIGGSSYGIYDNNLDWYFMAMTAADSPILLQNSSNSPQANKLLQQIILPPSGTTNIIITNGVIGDFVLTLNGLVLAKNYDYTINGSVVTLSGETVYDDIISVIYTTTGGNNLVGDVIDVSSSITSGTTNNQGENSVYFNTSTGKYEIYTSVIPDDGSAILVMINGATLASGVDYYQSTSNLKRIILEGVIFVDDIITIVYFPRSSVVNGLNVNQPTITWLINTPPQLVNGVFTLQVSTGNTFSTLFTSATTNYEIGVVTYNSNITLSGEVGTKLYYRIKNEKNYVNFCGVNINSIAYSETIPLTIQTNSINSY